MHRPTGLGAFSLLFKSLKVRLFQRLLSEIAY